MTTSLVKPPIGSTSWGTDVNNNWSLIEQLLLAGPNLCLNPGFELILPVGGGSHSTAITQLSGANSTKNSVFPGWIIFNKNGSTAPVTTVDQNSTHSGSSGYSAKITAVTGGTGGGGPYEQGIRQTWGGTDNGVAQYLDEFVYQVRDRKVSFAVDLQLSGTGVTAKIRIADGSTTTVVTHTGTTSWTRKVVTLDSPVASAATQIKIEVFLDTPSNNDFVYVDNCMIIATDSDSALSNLPYQPRLPVQLEKVLDVSTYLSYTAGSTSKITSGSSTFSPDIDFLSEKPHWATGFYGYAIAQRPSGANNNGSLDIYSSGFSNSLIHLTAADADAVTINSSQIKCPFGVDSQIQMQINAASFTGSINLTGWVGNGL